MAKVKTSLYTDEKLIQHVKELADKQDRSLNYLVEKALIEVYGNQTEEAPADKKKPVYDYATGDIVGYKSNV